VLVIIHNELYFIAPPGLPTDELPFAVGQWGPWVATVLVLVAALMDRNRRDKKVAHGGTGGHSEMKTQVEDGVEMTAWRQGNYQSGNHDIETVPLSSGHLIANFDLPSTSTYASSKIRKAGFLELFAHESNTILRDETLPRKMHGTSRAEQGSSTQRRTTCEYCTPTANVGTQALFALVLQERKDRITALEQERFYALDSLSRVEENLQRLDEEMALHYAQQLAESEGELEATREVLVRVQSKAAERQTQDLQGAMGQEAEALLVVEKAAKDKTESDSALESLKARIREIESQVVRLRRMVHELQGSGEEVTIMQLEKQQGHEGI